MTSTLKMELKLGGIIWAWFTISILVSLFWSGNSRLVAFIIAMLVGAAPVIVLLSHVGKEWREAERSPDAEALSRVVQAGLAQPEKPDGFLEENDAALSQIEEIVLEWDEPRKEPTGEQWVLIGLLHKILSESTTVKDVPDNDAVVLHMLGTMRLNAAETEFVRGWQNEQV